MNHLLPISPFNDLLPGEMVPVLDVLAGYAA